MIHKPDKASLSNLRDKLLQQLADSIQEKLAVILSNGIDPDTTSQRVDDLKVKYPGLPAQNICTLLIGQASRKNALTGGISSMVITGAEALLATPEPTQLTKIGGLGALISSSTADAISTTKVQMQLVYDLAYIHGAPYDINDSDDIWTVLFAAMGSSGAETVHNFNENVFADVARQQFQNWIRQGISNSVKMWIKRKLIPLIARKLALKYVTRLIPIANIAIGASSNYTTTLTIGDMGMLRARIRSTIFHAVDGVLALSPRRKTLIAGVVLTAFTSSEILTLNAANLYSQIIRRIKPTIREQQKLDELSLSDRIFSEVRSKLRNITDPNLCNAFFNLALVACAASKLAATDSDHNYLKSIADDCGVAYESAKLTKCINTLKGIV